ncbi:MAG: phosphomethylpyrimidine synthase ThiC [Candidatus Aminicenantia bacterium]
MSLIEELKKGNIPLSVKIVAEEESISVEELADYIVKGYAVILANKYRQNVKPVGVGYRLRTKVNTNLGTSMDFPHVNYELEKLEIALKYKTDTVMDLSTGGNINLIREEILKKSNVPVGTVPIYQATIYALSKYHKMVDLTVDDIFHVIEDQAKDGVDFITVHAGLTLKGIERLKKQGRLTSIVSRGGAFMVGWMIHNEKENPLYENFDRLLDIAKKYELTLSLGDGLRPGSIEDSTDWAQIDELIVLGELVKRAREAGVQAMVEGPGHIPINEISMNIKLQKKICDNAPFYVLGPLVTDIGVGYDHITAAIGGAIAASEGADFLCYVTPTEHIGLPDVEDVKQGLIAFKIAAHAGDIAKGIKGAKEFDRKFSLARFNLDWAEQERLSLDPDRFREVRMKRGSKSKACSMCSDFCAMKVMSEFLEEGNVHYLL